MLVLSGLGKRFGDTWAVADLSLEARGGEILGLLGPNGAGKTTTVHMVVGVLAPDRGHIDIAGLGGPRDPATRQRLGVAPQSLALYQELTGEENLHFFGSLYGLAGLDLRRRVREALAQVGLSDRAHDRVATYSGGMKRRLNLAAANLHEPRVLLFDEPTAGVDPQSRHAILELARAARDRGQTVIYTTHYLEEAQRLCDRVAIVDGGRLIASGTVDELVAAHGGDPSLVIEYDDDGAEPVRIDTRDPLAELTELAKGRPLRSFHVEKPSLEQVFLNLTGRDLRD